MSKTFFSKSFITTLLVGSLLLTGCQNTSVQQPTEKPETVIRNGFTELSKVEAYSFDFTMDMDARDPGSPLAKLAMKMGGFVDLKNPKEPKIALTIDGSGNDTAGTTKGSALLDLQLNKDVFFFKLDKFDVGTPLPPQFAEMVGKWWKITLPPEALTEMNKVFEEAANKQDNAEQEKMKKLLEENNFFGQPTFVTTEDVKGEPSSKYDVTIDKKMLVQFITKYNQTQTTSALSTADIKELQDGLNMTDITGSVWVGNNNKTLNKIALNIKVDDKVRNSSGTITTEVTFWDFGKDFTVEPHTDAQEFPIEQVLAPLMMGGGLPL